MKVDATYRLDIVLITVMIGEECHTLYKVCSWNITRCIDFAWHQLCVFALVLLLEIKGHEFE